MNELQPLRILVELRPALEGHAGIPQETRLLFRSLCTLDGVRAEGLMQSSSQVLPAGAPPDDSPASGSLTPDERIERMGRIVISMDKSRSRRGDIAAAMQTIWMALRSNFGRSERLTRFDSTHFRDYLWQRLFAKTLPAEDFDVVTGARFRIARLPWSALQMCARFTANFGAPIYGRLDTEDFDVMIAETPYPASVSRGTCLVVRYHDAIPLTMPHTISDNEYHHATHYLTLRHNIRSGAWFACVSDSTRNDLLAVFPEAGTRSVTIPNMVSPHYFDEDSNPVRIADIVAAHDGFGAAELSGAEGRFDYLLMVSSIEPRKNHLSLLSAWEQHRSGDFPALKLVVVGGVGWHNEQIMRKFRPWIERGDVLVLRNVAAADLRRLYKHALATVCPSFGEGFDFSGVEAMRSGGAVVASDIPVHREIYADAAEFFDPYSPADLAAAIGNVVAAANAARRAELVRRGAGVARRYEPQAIVPQWASFLAKLQAGA